MRPSGRRHLLGVLLPIGNIVVTPDLSIISASPRASEIFEYIPVSFYRTSSSNQTQCATQRKTGTFRYIHIYVAIILFASSTLLNVYVSAAHVNGKIKAKTRLFSKPYLISVLVTSAYCLFQH